MTEDVPGEGPLLSLIHDGFGNATDEELREMLKAGLVYRPYTPLQVTVFTAIDQSEESSVPEPAALCTDPNELEDPVEVEWSCGLAVGQPYWQTVDIYESDECSGEGVMWIERGDSPCVHCPVCGQFMEDSWHYTLKEKQ